MKKDIIIIARDESKCAEIRELLGVEAICASSGILARTIDVKQSELIIISTPLSDEYGLDLAGELSRKTNAALLILATQDAAEEVKKRLKFCGAYVLARPVSRQSLTIAAEFATFAEKKFAKNKKKFEEALSVLEAKVKLMDSKAESEAYKELRTKAMNERKTIEEVAREINEEK